MKARPQGSATSGSTSTAKHASFDDLAAYCPNLDQWPRSWRGEERDVPPGVKIVEYFTPFLRHLLNSNLSRRICCPRRRGRTTSLPPRIRGRPAFIRLDLPQILALP